ncbi:P-type conjugative transfer protein TrbL [Pandoraea apista]|uniref:P-type conjugative transfer protein TrbL n=1 Tax=Pandoraea apista TaxID=93218 RepID=UPI00065A120C|nr:P-type conjugative transfer protein TrbL [Pandoraea apista]ALS68412.1 P-type conjugative transfer protein TrbL [Pandoraea apista]CFB60436.1 TrbL/VirB6 plasmid conjugal transfer protein [Pandoraea apista]
MNRKVVLALAGTAALLMATSAFAADSSGMLDQILGKYKSAASNWSGAISTAATFIFWSIALMSMIWTFGIHALRRADFGDTFVELIRFITPLGFFWWLVLNGPAISTAILDGMRQLASQAGGYSTAMTPSGIVDIGFDILGKVIDNSSVWSPVNSLVGLLIAVAILICLLLVGVNMLLVLVSGWVLIYAGQFFLGFGGAGWTRDTAVNYMKTVVNIAIQAFTMVLLVGIGKSFVDVFYSDMAGGITFRDLVIMLSVAVVLLALINKLPPMMGGIFGGASTGGIGTAGAGAAMATMAAGIGALAATAAVAQAAASSVGGGMSALKAAYDAAKEEMGGSAGGGGSGGESSGDASVGGGSHGSSGSAGGGSGEAGGGQASGKSQGGSGGFSAAMGRMGQLAAGTAAHLAKGSAAVAKDRMEAMMDSAKERIAGTTGGQIAQEIRSPGSASQARQDARDMAKANELYGAAVAAEARDFIAGHGASQSGTASEPDFSGDSMGGAESANPSSTGDASAGSAADSSAASSSANSEGQASAAQGTGDGSTGDAPSSQAAQPGAQQFTPSAAEKAEIDEFVNNQQKSA